MSWTVHKSPNVSSDGHFTSAVTPGRSRGVIMLHATQNGIFISRIIDFQWTNLLSSSRFRWKAYAFPWPPPTGLNPIGNILFIPSCHNMYSKGSGNDRPPCPTLATYRRGQDLWYLFQRGNNKKKLDSGTGSGEPGRKINLPFMTASCSRTVLCEKLACSFSKSGH